MHILESGRLILRSIQLSDVSEKYLSWMTDPLVTCYLESRFQQQNLDSIKNYVMSFNNDNNNFFFIIIDKDKNEHIGNIKLGCINWTHGFGEIGLMIGDKTYWGKGYATEAILTITKFGFQKFKLNKLLAGCYENNVGSLKAFKKAGFEIEGISRNRYCDRYVNGIQLSIMNNENNMKRDRE